MKPSDAGDAAVYTTCADSWHRPGLEVEPDKESEGR
jgi:hypothetical protein